MALHIPGQIGFVAVVAASGIAAAVTQIGPFGATWNVCSGAAANTVDELPLGNRTFPLVDRARKGDRWNVSPAGSGSAVPWEDRWPVETAPLRREPATNEPKSKLQIGCELPLAGHLATGRSKRSQVRCVTNLAGPDRTFG
jgi:hypothetical protein